MDLRQLRYFVAVAEELHFSRAAARLRLAPAAPSPPNPPPEGAGRAARLRLAQSALSSQIRQLEREVGGPLLVRSTRRVELTPAGGALRAAAQALLAAADGALERARALARGEAGSLTIGWLGPAPGGILAPLLARFGGRHPDVRVEIRSFDFTDTVDGLRDRHADCAFLYLPLEDPDLDVVPLLSEERVVVLAQSHRLARRRALRPADLVDETFIVQPASVPQAWRDHWLLVAENGRRPPVCPHTADKLDDWLHLIASGAGIDTAPAIISRYYAWPEVAYVPLVDAAPSTLALARRRDDDNPLVGDI